MYFEKQSTFEYFFMKSIIVSFTIWVVTALFNALLSGGWMLLFSNEFTYWPVAFFAFFFFTLVFSIPGMFIFWIVFVVNRCAGALFRLLLKTGFIISAVSSLMIYVFNADGLDGQEPFLMLFIVVAWMNAIMIHHSWVKSMTANRITGNHS